MKQICRSHKASWWQIAATTALWMVLGTLTISLAAAVASEALSAVTDVLDQLTLAVGRAEQALRIRPF